MHHTGHDFCSIDGAWVTQCFLSSALSLVIVYRGQLRCQQASMEWEMLWQIMADVMSLTAQWLYSIVTIQHTCRSRRSLTSWHKKLLPMLWMLSRARSTSSPIIMHTWSCWIRRKSVWCASKMVILMRMQMLEMLRMRWVRVDCLFYHQHCHCCVHHDHATVCACMLACLYLATKANSHA